MITVYYDGLCHLCSREINHYRSMKGADRINFVDITSFAFDAAKERLDPIQIHKAMHVRDNAGTIRVGVDGFTTIWEELPALRPIVPLARFGPIHLLLRIGYSLFAKIRPLLPRKSCEQSPYCETSIGP